MAKLQVTLHGQLLAELYLQPGQEYYAGRGSQCAIVLESERGISRQHIKIFQEGSNWVAQLISKFGGLVFEGQTVDTIHLQGDVRFSVPPYEFSYSEANEKEIAPPSQSTAPSDPNIVSSNLESPGIELSEDSVGGNLDATAAGLSTLVAYLKINNNKIRTSEILKLEGNMWTLGRQPSCEIVVNDTAISRKHFDLTRTAEGYFITDYGSSNGTKINGDKIEPNVAKKIHSGDVIAVRHIEIIFEIHDSSYEKNLAIAPDFEISAKMENEEELQLPPDLQPHSSSQLPAVYQQSTHDGPAVLRIPAPERFNIKKTSPMHIILGILALILIFGLMSGGNQGKKESTSKSTEEMSPDKKKQIVDMFNLAQNYYVERKYVMCLSQIEKLHSEVPFHSNSKELESLCKQALELQQIEEDRRRKEESRAVVENKIRSNTDECKAKINPQMTVEELNTCLQPSLELDPQNGMILDLLSQVQVFEETKKDQNARQADLVRRKQEGKNIYNRAQNYQRTNQLKPALNEYKRFVGGRYPGLNQEEDNAKRSIATISQSLNQQLSAQIAKCQTSLNQADLKGAVISCDSVLKENPQSKEAREIRDKAYSQLLREMKALYEDSRIEESLGNIDAAKDKWTKIVDKSVPQDDYYKKAKKNLKKYGIGM